MPRKKSKNPQRLGAAICKTCGSSFERLRASKIYCQPKCSATPRMARYRRAKTPTQTRRYIKKIDKFLRTSFARWLIAELKRAGTVQVLSGHTAETLDSLFRLHKNRVRHSGYMAGKPTAFYHLGHIFPVMGKTKIGLLHPDNLVITPAKINTARKAGEPTRPDAGVFLQRSELIDHWHVAKEQTAKQILCLTQEFLGMEWKTFVATIALQQTQVEALIKKLKKQGLQVHALSTLDELKNMAESHGVTYFSLSRDPTPESDVALLEMERFGQVNDRRYALIKEAGDRLWSLEITEEEEEEISVVLNRVTRDCFNFLNGDNATQNYEEECKALIYLVRAKRTNSVVACGMDYVL